MGSTFFNVEPEVAGRPVAGSRPGAASCAFDIWLGDDVIRAYPAVLVTTAVKRALLELPQSTGFDITRARTRATAFYGRHSTGRRLPVFWAIQAKGQAGRDDIGFTEGGVLVVSRRVLDVLLEFRIARAVITQYVSAPGERKQDEP